MVNEPGQSVVTPPTEVTPIDPDQAETVADDTSADDLSQLKSLEDKLTYTLGTKTAIKNAIEAKGVTVPEGTVFRDYAAKIGEIESGGGFTGTATVTLSGEAAGLGYGYIDEGMNLLLNSNASSSDFPLTVPVPQIIYISAYGRNEGMSISGNYEIVRNIGYPTAKAIYIKGDITVTPS